MTIVRRVGSAVAVALCDRVGVNMHRTVRVVMAVSRVMPKQVRGVRPAQPRGIDVSSRARVNTQPRPVGLTGTMRVQAICSRR